MIQLSVCNSVSVWSEKNVDVVKTLLTRHAHVHVMHWFMIHFSVALCHDVLAVLGVYLELFSLLCLQFACASTFRSYSA